MEETCIKVLLVFVQYINEEIHKKEFLSPHLMVILRMANKEKIVLSSPLTVKISSFFCYIENNISSFSLI